MTGNRIVTADMSVLEPWNNGMKAAEECITASSRFGLFTDSPSFSDSMLALMTAATRVQGISLLRPEGKVVGCKMAASDPDEEEEGEGGLEQQQQQRVQEAGGEEDVADGEEIAAGAAVLREGDSEADAVGCWFNTDSNKKVHKTIVVREMFERGRASADQNGRVTGASKYGGGKKPSQQALLNDEEVPTVELGAPFITNVIHRGRTGLAVCRVAGILLGDKQRPFSVTADEATAPSTSIYAEVLRMVPQGAAADENEQLWVWDTSIVGHTTVQGNLIVPVDPIMDRLVVSAMRFSQTTALPTLNASASSSSQPSPTHPLQPNTGSTSSITPPTVTHPTSSTRNTANNPLVTLVQSIPSTELGPIPSRSNSVL